MSASSRCVVIGIVVFFYWMAAFWATALTYHQPSVAPDWLAGPGIMVGRPFVDLLRSIGANRVCQPGTVECWLAMLAGAASIGTGAWVLSALLSGWWQRRKSPRLLPPRDK